MHLKMPAAHLSSRPSCFATKRPPVLAVRRWQTFAAFAAVGSSRWLSTGVACGDGDAPVRLGVAGPESVGVGGVRTVKVASPPPLELAPLAGSTAEMMAMPGPTAVTRLLRIGSLGATTTLESLEL